MQRPGYHDRVNVQARREQQGLLTELCLGDSRMLHMLSVNAMLNMLSMHAMPNMLSVHVMLNMLSVNVTMNMLSVYVMLCACCQQFAWRQACGQ